MAYKPKSWREKLVDDKNFPKIVKLSGRLEKAWGSGTCVIAKPREIDEIMKKVPKGKLITINKIREILAKRHKTTIACPITTGIFARISAGTAEENAMEGKRDITPYWRTVKDGGAINEKYPGGLKGQKKLLEKEGLKVIQKGKKYIIEDYERYLMEIE